MGQGHEYQCGRVLLIRTASATVMFVDMYGRVKARLTTGGESSRKSKAS